MAARNIDLLEGNGHAQPIKPEVSRQEVLSRKIDWQRYHSATLLQDNELRLLQLYDTKPWETKEQLLLESGPEYVQLFLALVTQINTNTTLQYVLALIDEMLSEDESLAALFLQDPRDPFTPFVQVLYRDNEDEVVEALASKVLALLLVKGHDHRREASNHHAADLFRWCADQLRKEFPNILRSLAALQILMRCEEFRIMWRDTEDGISALILQTRPQIDAQIIYQALYALWLMSYSEEIADKIHKTTAIAKIVEAIKLVQKEKVIRIGLATLKNLKDKGPSGQNNRQMIECGFMRVLENLQLRNWGDEEMLKNMEALMESLQRILADMSSFDMYRNEILSGNLEWSPVHKSEKFWRENIMKMEDNQFELLGVLVHLLNNSQNSLVLAVACHDIGEFVRFHPRGRNIVSTLGAKQAIMRLMENQNPDVQKHALMCTQKLLVVNWENLSR